MKQIRIQIIAGVLLGVLIGPLQRGWGAEGISTSFVDVEAANVPLGKTVPIVTRWGQGIVVTNKGDSSILVTVRVLIPRAKQLRKGAKPIADPAWFTISPQQPHVAPHTSEVFNLSVAVPDKPEYRGQKYQAMILCRGQVDQAKGIALRAGLLSRIWINTQP